MISRKIWATAKFQDFHAVQCTYISRKRHNIFIVWQFSFVECIVKIDELSNNVVHKIQEGSSLWDDLYYRTNLDNLGWDLIRLSQLIPIKTVLPFFIFFLVIDFFSCFFDICINFTITTLSEMKTKKLICWELRLFFLRLYLNAFSCWCKPNSEEVCWKLRWILVLSCLIPNWIWCK